MIWPHGDGEMAGRIRTLDWATTPLGPVDAWPQNLKTTVDLILAQGFPMLLLWGPERIGIYNDAFVSFLSDRHPVALGNPLYAAWPELRDPNEALMAPAWQGRTVTVKEALFPDAGHRGFEDARFDATIGPVRDDRGAVVGVLVTAVETTEHILTQRTLRDSAERYRAFVSASADVIYRMSADWSEMRQLDGRDFLRDTGAPDADWLDSYIHPDDQDAVRAAIARAIAGKSVFQLEHRVIRVDGSLGVTRSRAVPILDDAGEIREWLGTASDITTATDAERARTATEASSRKVEARYLALFNAIDQGFCTVEVAFDAQQRPVDYRFLEVSPSFERQTGMIDATGRWMREIAPDHDQHWFDIYGRVALTGEAETFEEFSTPLDRWFEVFAFRTDDPACRRVGILFRDVTERRRAEAALRESEERLQQFGEASQDVLWVRDARTFQWEYLTPAFETVYGLDREDALRGDNMTNWLELVVPDDRELAARSLQRVRDGKWVTFEYRIRRPEDGQIRWLRDTDFPIRDVSGDVVRIGGIGHDITALKETEIALAEALKRQRALLEGIPQLVWRAVDEGRWTWASPQWSVFTGLPEEASYGHGWLTPVHPDDREGVLALWRGAKARGSFEAEYRMCSAREQRYRWFQTRATPVRGDRGEIVEWFGTSTDVDDLRAMQARQQVLLAELQHRVRNILAIIRSIMRRSLNDGQSLQDYAQHLEGRLSALARTQVLLTRQVDAHVDLEELVRDELTAQAADMSRITLAGPDIDLPPKAAEVLALAVHELATNALKYGAIGRSDAHLTVTWRTEDRSNGRWLAVFWTETGVPVPGDAIRRRGFGTELITRRVPYELKGRGDLELKPDGIVCTIAFPLIEWPSILESGSAQQTYGA